MINRRIHTQTGDTNVEQLLPRKSWGWGGLTLLEDIDNGSRSGRSPGYSWLHLGDHWFKYSPLLLPSKHTKSMVKKNWKDPGIWIWSAFMVDFLAWHLRNIFQTCSSLVLQLDVSRYFQKKSFISWFQHRKSRWKKKHKSHEYVVVTYTNHRYIQYKYIPSGYLT